jgi:hypothetical protein
MELLISKKGIPLPKLFFITDREEIKTLPKGIPFIYGDKASKTGIVRMLEYEVLYQSAIKSKFPFNFKTILKDAGFSDLQTFSHGSSTYGDIMTSGEVSFQDVVVVDKAKSVGLFKKFVRDESAYVDVSILKELNVFPVWLSDIEEAVNTNLMNFATIDSNMYNKKLEGMYGGVVLTSPNKNLIIVDISSSIPRAVSTTCLLVAKNLVESFYADLIITGSNSTLYEYEEIGNLDVESIYETNGMSNEQRDFKNILHADERTYETVIAFGDNDNPGAFSGWEDGAISNEKGKELCRWDIKKLISLHTRGTNELAGYARWFTVSESDTTRIDNWVKYLK